MLRAMVTTKQSRSALSSPQHSHQHQGQCHRAGGCSPAKGAQVLHGGKAVRAHARKAAAAGQHHCQHHYHCCHPAPCKCKAHRWQSQLDTEAHSVVMSGIVTKHATCKATHGRGYRGILPALFDALTILWSADLHGLLPRWQQSTLSLVVPRRCLMGSGLAEMLQGWSLAAGMHFIPTYSGSRMPAAPHYLPSGSLFHSQTLPAPGLLQVALLQALAEHVTLAGVTGPSPCRSGEGLPIVCLTFIKSLSHVRSVH